MQVSDLKDFGDEEIQSIEDSVKDGTFGGLVDFESKAVRMKYLGIDLQNL